MQYSSCYVILSDQSTALTKFTFTKFKNIDQQTIIHKKRENKLRSNE